MMHREETQVQIVPILSENVKMLIRRSDNFMSCFRKEDIARKFVDETGIDATVNRGYIGLSPGDKLISVSKNEEGDLIYWWINPLYLEEC
tara:strand:+ start:5716 stop:5985 length:270 start_codon:yes stop_codon:yes gene_type:complete